MAITPEQIHAVADQLNDQGVNPTLSAVRKALGSGSFTTISDAMTTWRANQAAKKGPIVVPLPEALAGAVADFGGLVWSTAVELATARLASERDAFEQERQQADQMRLEAMELADSLAADLAKLQQDLAQATGRATTAEGALAGVQGELTDVRIRAAAAESRAQELSERVTALTEEAGRLHKHNEQLALVLAQRPGNPEPGQDGPAR